MSTLKNNKSNTMMQDKTKNDHDMTGKNNTIQSQRPNTVFPKHLRPLTGFTNAFDTSKISKQNFNIRP